MQEKLKAYQEFLQSNGYKHWASKRDRAGDYSFVTEKYQKRADGMLTWVNVPLCECNDKLLVNIEVNTITVGGKENTRWTIYMTHQSPVNNEWCDLKIYNLPMDKMNGVDLKKFEITLRNMWITFNKEN